MNEVARTLFGLDKLGFAQEGVQLGFARPIPAWGWALVIGAAVAIAWWSYWRLDAARRGRVVLASLRALVLVLLALIVSGPRLVRPNIVVEPDWVIVLADRSQSMQIRDVGEGERETRDAELHDMLRESEPMWKALGKERRVVWLGFDAGAYDLETDSPTDDEIVTLGQPEGTRTSLANALDQAMRRAAARPVSAVIVFSDGRSIDRPTRQTMRRLEAERIPVHTVALGRAEPLADLSIDRVQSPRMAFVNDTIPVSVRVRRQGGDAWPSATVQLIDKRTAIVLDEQPLREEGQAIPEDEHSATVQLRASPEEAGEQSWAVRVVTRSPDLVDSNNEVAVGIDLVDRPLRVLYLDGYPRWENRYVKNLLLREKSIQSSSLLVASNRRYTQEGDRLIDAVPHSPEEWAEFDVVVIGDVRADLFTTEQLEQLREHVAVRGAGLLWIAGPGATPDTWRDTPLADLVPFRQDANTRRRGIEAYDGPVTMTRTKASEDLGLLGLGEDGLSWPSTLSDPRTGWSRLWYAQKIADDALKPAAQVLATFLPARPVEASPTPAVISMRYGAGRVIYVATDEIWRWRFGRGETLPERFWLPLIRLQGRESLARGGVSALLEATPRRGVVGEPIRIAIRLLDESLLESRPRELAVRIKTLGDVAAPDVELRLAPEDAGADGLGRAYSATWVSPAAGKYLVEASEAMLSGMDLSAEIEVVRADDELRNPETDHALLASLSAATGGQMLDAGDLSKLAELLPRRRTEIAGEPDVETLWDKPIVLAVLVVLLGAEWVGRRLLRLS